MIWMRKTGELGAADELSLPGLEGPSSLPLITRALTERGVPEDAILKILGSNVLSLLPTILSRPA
ncbi:hypothetical protein ACWD4K_28220 [Streptomyces gelaticus]